MLSAELSSSAEAAIVFVEPFRRNRANVYGWLIGQTDLSSTLSGLGRSRGVSRAAAAG